MSTQFPQQQQPVVVYPNTVSGQLPPSSSSSHSNGSFGTVFVVLAVIVVVSAIACCLGRLCNRRKNKQKPSKNGKQKHSKGRERESDIEFGFEKGLASKPAGFNGDGKGGQKPFQNGHMNGGGGQKPFQNGHMNGGGGQKPFQNGHMNGGGGGHHKNVQFNVRDPVINVGEPKVGFGP